METLLKDVRFAVRTLRKQPAFTVTAVLTLALAIGATTAMFSVVESTLLRPLPFRTPGRLAFLWGVAGPQRDIRGASFIEVQDWARLNRTFESVAIYDETSLNMRTDAGAERVEAEMVSASYFPMLGAAAALGRTFTADEDRVPDANAVAVISDDMWRTRFGGAPDIVGRRVVLNDLPFTVVGVMPKDFKGISFDTDVWFPAMMVRANGGPSDLTARGSRWLGAVGRLKPGVTLEQAQADADRVAGQLARDFPVSNKDRGVQLFSLRNSYLGSTKTLVLAVFAAVGLLLLIACTNVASLQLVRASGRRREMALRMAIGADRSRIVQQLVVEGLVLALGAAVVAILVAYWGLAGLTALVPSGLLPRYATPSLNIATFGFTLLIAMVCGGVFGLVPAFRDRGVVLSDSLKEGARGSATGFGRGRRLGAQQLFVVGETALALVLLIGAGLFVRSLQRQLSVTPGFDARGVLRARLTLPQNYTREMRLQFAEQLETRLAGIPSARAATVASDLPLAGGSSAAFIHVPELNHSVRFYRHFVTPRFFDALGIHVRSGRAFTASDREDSPRVVAINASAAGRFWPNENAVGKRLRLGDEKGAELTVVGVIDDVRYRDLTTALATSEPDVYFPLAQNPTSSLQIAVRSDVPTASLAEAIRREVAGLDPSTPLFGVRALDELLAQQTSSGRFASSVLSVFGCAAVVLTAVGLYGVLTFLITLRRREIGIRIALGASTRRVLTGVVGQGLMLVALGLVIGVALAVAATGIIVTQLYGIGARDPVVFTVVPALLLAVAMAASWIPARRAARVDPQIALRSE
jgi:putative ABC transport system permease protein